MGLPSSSNRRCPLLIIRKLHSNIFGIRTCARLAQFITMARAQDPLFHVDLSRLNALAKPEVLLRRVVLIYMCPMAKDQTTN